MARGQITIYEVPANVRARGAKNARLHVQQILANPFLTNDQREELRERLVWIGKLERLDVAHAVPRPAPKDDKGKDKGKGPPSRQPVNHTVDLEEDLSIDEEV